MDKKDLKYIALAFTGLLIVGISFPVLFYQYEKKNTPIKREAALNKIEDDYIGSLEHMVDEGTKELEHIQKVGGKNPEPFMSEEEVFDLASNYNAGEGYMTADGFVPNPNQLVPNAYEQANYKEQLLTYLYAGNFIEGRILANSILSTYNLSLLENEYFEQMLSEANYMFFRMYEGKELPFHFAKVPEIAAFIFLQKEFDEQFLMILEKNSLIVSNNSQAEIVDIREVTPSKDTQKHFLGTSRGKGYNVFVETVYGTVALHLYQEPDNTFHVVNIRNVDSNITSTYQDVADMYEPDIYSDVLHELEGNFKSEETKTIEDIAEDIEETTEEDIEGGEGD